MNNKNSNQGPEKGDASKSTLNDLLSCPFCGENEDIAVRFGSYDGTCEPIRGHTYAYVECMPCDCRTGNCFENDVRLNGFESCKAMAVAFWNKRSDILQTTLEKKSVVMTAGHDSEFDNRCRVLISGDKNEMKDLYDELLAR